MSYRDDERALAEQIAALEAERERQRVAIAALPAEAPSGPRWRVRALGFLLAFGAFAAIGLPFCTFLTSVGEGGDRLYVESPLHFLVREGEEQPLESCALELSYLDEDLRCHARLRCGETTVEGDGDCRKQSGRSGIVFRSDTGHLAASTGWSGRAAVRAEGKTLQLARRIDTKGQVAEVRPDESEVQLGDGAVLTIDEETRISGDVRSLAGLAERLGETDVMRVESQGIYERRRGELKQSLGC